MVNLVKYDTVNRHVTALSNIISCNAKFFYSVVSKALVKREHIQKIFRLHIVISELNVNYMIRYKKKSLDRTGAQTQHSLD